MDIYSGHGSIPLARSSTEIFGADISKGKLAVPYLGATHGSRNGISGLQYHGMAARSKCQENLR